MDDEVLEELFSAIGKHTNRLNKLDKSSDSYQTKLDSVEAKLISQLNLAITSSIKAIPTPEKPDYSVYDRILKDDFDRLIDKHNITIKEVEASLKTYTKSLAVSASSVSDGINKHINTIKATLIGSKGDKGDTGATGSIGLAGKAGINGIDGKNGTNGRDGKSSSTSGTKELKELISKEVKKLKPSYPAPTPANGLSMIAVQAEIDTKIAAISNVDAIDVRFTAYGNIATTNVQTAIQELDDEKLGKPTIATTATNLTLDQTHGLVTVTAACTVTLPAAAPYAQQVYTVKSVTTSNVTISCTDLIDGDTTQIITVKYTAVRLISDGSTWHII